MDKKSKVIVTGGAGFIGSHLVDGLVDQGYDVHVIDNMPDGKSGHVNPRALFHHADIRDFSTIASIFENTRYVFHTAALPRVQPSIIDPRLTHDVNVNGTLNVLVASRDAKVKRVIY